MAHNQILALGHKEFRHCCFKNDNFSATIVQFPNTVYEVQSELSYGSLIMQVHTIQFVLSSSKGHR